MELPVPPHRNCQEDWIVWQLADSALPTGGFAHSGGLEAAFQHGEVRKAAGVEDFVQAALWQAAHGQAPLAAAVWDEPGAFDHIDELCDAFTANHVANRASRLQGRALAATAAKAFGKKTLLALCHRAAKEDLPTHYAPVFGFVASALGVGRQTSLRLFFYLQMRGLLSSAVRLGIIGPLEAQAMQARLAPVAERALEHSTAASLDQIAQTAPLLDLWQGAHDRLYSRLFQS